MKVTLEFAAGNGEQIAKDVYVPKRGERVPFAGTGHVGEVVKVSRGPRKVVVDLRVKQAASSPTFGALPGLTP